MLNLFYKDGDKKRYLQYKTAYVKQEDGNKQSFKYYELDREDITKITFLKGIESQQYQKIIRTTNTYPFDVKTKILIDGFQYTILNIYRENQEINNGLFRKVVKPYTYLTLNR